MTHLADRVTLASAMDPSPQDTPASPGLTLPQVAAAAGVSRSTVRRALDRALAGDTAALTVTGELHGQVFTARRASVRLGAPWVFHLSQRESLTKPAPSARDASVADTDAAATIDTLTAELASLTDRLTAADAARRDAEQRARDERDERLRLEGALREYQARLPGLLGEMLRALPAPVADEPAAAASERDRPTPATVTGRRPLWRRVLAVVQGAIRA